ncbi:4Fe-4S single cluster domain-containing protein [Schlesneria sp. DSM 10557]|uniref:4Fe-4S single cluster domain-containing protein n=1 Tax=Schlesneria sp. DSM 10557 TaxID=3044399 RepID=UPI0035A0C8BC
MQQTTTGLRVVRFQERSQALGPGTRAVIWFQGCTFDCPGCIAAEMNHSNDFELTTPSDLVERVLKISGIEGVTLSGGDPFDQPLTLLAEFLEILNRQSELSVMCYTGRTLDQLRRRGANDVTARILSRLDILIDGLYVESLNDGRAWRGSSNQEIHFLSPRYHHLETSILESRDRELEVSVGPTRQIEITGIPPAGFMGRLQGQLKLRDLSLEFHVPRDEQPGAK